MSLPQNPSKSFVKLNPHLYPTGALQGHSNLTPPDCSGVQHEITPKKRLRQSSKGMNKLEQAFSECLKPHAKHSGQTFLSQSVTFKLANGLRYTPDFFSFEWAAVGELDRATAWEVKGHMRDDAACKLKMFAAQYPQVRVILVWKENGLWQSQRILP